MSTQSEEPLTTLMHDDIVRSKNASMTTEELFTQIHRSKIKHLGRKHVGDSNGLMGHDPRTRSTCMAAPPSAASIQPTKKNVAQARRANVQIHRSAEKSNTSIEEFKLLLKGKGERSQFNRVMPATENMHPKKPVDHVQEEPADAMSSLLTCFESMQSSYATDNI
ncbi:actin remodeling regulator NHS-like [Synchiropus splendidus]|uniref:actin remodeling regulator NHS-like n=1 Tax=Synchiropus splendidus TaxID=270530 RepID=UPI00237ED71F|nr:actin remodeling regulator NHS-like [Synchiropus splendidus]